jgi:tripartite-type tricarboxylate transporter receptor subunit TctC
MRISSPIMRAMGTQYPEEVDPLVAPWFASHTKAELEAIALASNLIVAPLRGIEEVLDTAQFAQRGFFEKGRAADRDVTVPGLPFRVLEARDETAPNLASGLLRGARAEPPAIPAGSAARYLAQQLARAIGQNVIIDNRAGAAGNIGTQFAAKSAPDGYTLIMGTNGTHAAAPFLFVNPGFDPDADFDPIALTGILPIAIVTSLGNPVDNVQKLVAAARARPDAINVAVTTTTSRSTLELLRQQAGAPLFPVLYKGSAQAITDLIGGQVDYMVDTVASVRAQVVGGKLKALSITSLAGSELLPGVKSVAEQGVANYQIAGWNVLYAPRGTPVETIQLLAGEMLKIMAQPETRQRMLSLGIDPQAAAGADLKSFLRTERDKWGRLIKAMNIKPE